MREAAKKWKEKEEVIDDITCVVVFMDLKLLEKSLKHKEMFGIIEEGEELEESGESSSL